MVTFVPTKSGQAANVSDATHAITEAVIAWGMAKWPGARAIRELALGNRRIDVLFVTEQDVAGVEIKGPKDTLDRLQDQLREYGFWLPRVYAAVDVKFKPKLERAWIPNLLWVENGAITLDGHEADRDDLCCSRLLDLLWRDEAAAIAVRTGVIPGRVPKQFNRAKVLSMLARLLSGHEVVKQVCLELRARQLVGMGSSPPLRPSAASSPRTGELPLPHGAGRSTNEGPTGNVR